MKKVSKPWGYELIFAHTDRYAGKILHVRAGEKLSLQYHEVKDETIYLARGELLLVLDSDDGPRELLMHEGDVYHIPPRTVHRMEAKKDTDIFEVSTPELDDVVRLEDDYGRVEETSPGESS